MRGLPTLAVGLAAGVISTAALAEYPEQPVTYIYAHNPGGGTEVGIRTWAPYMEQCLGETLVIQSRPGAGGAIGFAEIATSAPDGYTFGQLTTPGFVTAGFGKDLPFNRESFEILGNLVGVSSVLTVHRGGRLKSLKDVLDHAKTSPQPINVGVGSIGNDDHLAGLQLMNLSGSTFNLIPFGDNSQTRNALLGGHVDIVMMNNSEIVRFLDDLEPLAIASNERNKLLPDVPTFKELGYDLVAGTTHVVGAPKGVPEPILAKWRECLGKIAVDPKFLADAEKRAIPLLVMDAEQTSAHVVAQEAEYRELYELHPWGQ